MEQTVIEDPLGGEIELKGGGPETDFPVPPLRVVFMGTPEFAAVILKKLAAWPGADVIRVYTQPDRPCGRGRECRPSAVKLAALEAGIEIRQPANFKDPAEREALRALSFDVLAVAAYGIILPQAVLDAPKLLPVNVHASLLPHWRGAAPIQRALDAGDTATGITIMRMTAGLDAGPILLQRALRIADSDTAGTLHDELAEMGGDALLDALSRLPKGRLMSLPQDESLATYAAKLTKEEGRIDWNLPAERLHDHIRAVTPWPGAYFDWMRSAGKPLRLGIAPGRVGAEKPAGLAPGTVVGFVDGMLAIAAADKLYLTPHVTPQGKKPQDARAFACGYLKDACQ